jgi:hypothetical protein
MTQPRIRIAAGLALSLLVAAACAGTSPSPSAPAGPSGTIAAADPTNGLATGTRLVVLAEGGDGVAGLWALTASGWAQLGTAPGATGIGTISDGIAIATGRNVELRPATGLGSTGTARTLKWPGSGSGSGPMAPIVSLSTSPAGKLAIVTSDAQGSGYLVAAVDGTVAPVDIAPMQSFTPSAAWLDESHLLVLSTDQSQMSRLASMDCGDGTLSTGRAVTGIRVAGLSADRSTAAVATESGLYVGSVPSLLGQTAVQPAITLEAAQIVWALTLDADGKHVFLLSGQMAPDGKVSSVRELGYTQQGSSWVKMLDVPVPFGRAIGQVFLG